MEIEPEALKKARAFYAGPRYVQGDILNAPWKPEVFDWCVSLETVEHLPTPEDVLEGFRASCTRLIVSTPNQEKYPFDPMKFEGDKYPHIRHYTPMELEKLLNDCGWTVLQRFTQLKKTSPVTSGTDGMFLVYVCR